MTPMLYRLILLIAGIVIERHTIVSKRFLLFVEEFTIKTNLIRIWGKYGG
jgi:hypothetical protein